MACTCRTSARCPECLGLVPAVVEEWLVIDRWWTDEPFTIYYRQLRDGTVESAPAAYGPWAVVPGAT